MENGILNVKNEAGKEKEYNILFMFKEEEKNEDYVVYTDYSLNDDGDINVYRNRYVKFGEKFEMLPINNREVIQFIDDKLEEIRLEIVLNAKKG